MDLNIGDSAYLSTTDIVMTDEQFESLLAGKSQNTTIPYMRRAKELIIRRLLSIGTDRKGINERKVIIGGTYASPSESVEGRIFLVEEEDKVTLLWRGPAREFRPNYMRIRDELAGKVPYRKYGRAAALEREMVDDKSIIRPVRTVQSTYVPKVGAANSKEAAFVSPRRKTIAGQDLSDQIGRYVNGDPLYDALVRDVCRCPGGCLRGANNANPMLRPSEGFRVPSAVMFLLEKPNQADDELNKCLTMGPEDYVRSSSDPTARALQELCDILGFSYRDIYIINSLLCWQFENSSDWERCWIPCLGHGWLGRAIDICRPKIIIPFGVSALRATNYVLHGPTGQPKMADNMNRPTVLKGIHVWPLVHPGPTARQTYPLALQKQGWLRLRDYMQENGIAAL